MSNNDEDYCEKDYNNYSTKERFMMLLHVKVIDHKLLIITLFNSLFYRKTENSPEYLNYDTI